VSRHRSAVGRHRAVPATSNSWCGSASPRCRWSPPPYPRRVTRWRRPNTECASRQPARPGRPRSSGRPVHLRTPAALPARDHPRPCPVLVVHEHADRDWLSRHGGTTVGRPLTQQRAVVLVLGSVQQSLAATARADVASRPVKQVSSRKALWATPVAASTVGPLAYSRWERRTQPPWSTRPAEGSRTTPAARRESPNHRAHRPTSGADRLSSAWTALHRRNPSFGALSISHAARADCPCATHREIPVSRADDWPGGDHRRGGHPLRRERTRQSQHKWVTLRAS
jgi:hypothetical protein